MAKKTTKRPGPNVEEIIAGTGSPADPVAPATGFVTTFHGDKIPAAELQHIAPMLQRFAIGIGKLSRDPKNARKHDKLDLAATAASLRRFKQQAVIVYDPKTFVLKVGNGRHEAAQSILEWKYIAAMPFDGTTEEFRAYALVDNRTAELSSWDPKVLAEEIEAIQDSAAMTSALANMPPLEEMGLGTLDVKEIRQEVSRKNRATKVSAEGKEATSVAATFWKLELKVGSERHLEKLKKAIRDLDGDAIVDALHGVEMHEKDVDE